MILQWDEYIKNVLDLPSPLNQLSVTIGEHAPVPIPPLIKATLHFLKKMGKSESIHNVIVLPERTKAAHLLLLSSVINNIVSGKIEWGYDPEEFEPGQKLKYENYVMEFIRIEERFSQKTNEKQKYIRLKFAQTTEYEVPIGDMPFFQKTDTNRPPSPFGKFFKAYKAKEELGYGGNIIQKLQDYKTHMTTSVFYNAPIAKTKGLLSTTLINEKPAYDTFLIGNVDYKGVVHSIGKGQLDGTPAIVLSSDLFYTVKALENEAPVQSGIINISSENFMDSNLPALDELCQKNLPLICITDTANSFDLQHLEKLGFNVWRWDAKSLTADLVGSSLTPIDSKLSNCVKNKIEYEVIQSDDISIPVQILNRYNEEIERQSPKMMKTQEYLWQIAFQSLRTIVKSPPKITVATREKLSVCANNLASEKNYISGAMYHDFMKAVTCFKNIYTESSFFPKIDALENEIIDNSWHNICIVIPNGFSKEDVRSFWINRLAIWEHEASIEVLNPQEFLNSGPSACEIVVIAGWLGKDNMRKILFSYNAAHYLVLLYDCEKNWCNSSLNQWNSTLNNEGNMTVAEHYLSNKEQHIDTTLFAPTDPIKEIEKTLPIDSDDIDHLFRINKYKHYTATSSADSTDRIVDACYVNYAGEYFSFLTPTYKILTVTDIVLNDGDNAKSNMLDELKVDDFVVVRTASKDLIREYADKILEKNNAIHYRETIEIWKKTLRKEEGSSSFDILCHNLKAAGCKREKATIRNWLINDDMIIPEKLDDLNAIAQISKDISFQKRVKEIFDAGKTVSIAHRQAGLIISRKLKNRIAKELQKLDNFDVHNMLDTFTFEIDKGLTVYVLKIIDINRTPLPVPSQNTNKLLSE